ncbi:flagellar biosynthesis protein FlhA [Defluviitalea raffinosedens]|uniref:Flagellar biosynthesis protein FlhA n=1 Tax=Defluviitalea raffinosedens TaxID=1450156 RepID=A0A7C8HG76_9FIRM|nr:flagellar biosynthesis protein FlhA [Defluviitalea raffinosedens]KAE9637055.1 flagellar biosynthesis protein FlhA [Defluviitalea raffinosedens]HHW67372.1 flagellar biosynthesis protein FlhA [Candidatus Epulonipiscium sp.]
MDVEGGFCVKSGNMFLGAFVISIIMMIIIPLPQWVLDIFFTINIAVALIILLNTLFSKEATDMSMFPSILLITTLFRLALNISSTRSILGEGYAGEVVNAFGSFVAGGNIVLGAVVFIIIVIIQFLVITKGAERVAEVSARFTLDAMPGKQMAIDADLNTGLIDEAEAKARRKKIQEEAQFYGAMDGASKFVKNDAIAGIIITFINIIGGLILGTTGITTGKPMPLSEALQVYTILTIGDGLVSQIPSLLISTATGILVTKTATESEMSSDLFKQLGSTPMVFQIAGGTLIVLGITTPLPWYIMVPVGILLIAGANSIEKNIKLQTISEEVSTEDIEAEEVRRPENVVSLLQIDPIELEFGYGIIPLADVNQGGDLLDRVVMIRRQIALELGAIVPIIRLRDNIQLSPNQYIIKIKGVEVAQGEILFDHYMAMNPGYVEEEIDGIETIEPAFGLPALWISESQREKAEMLGYTVVDPPSIIATHLTEVIKKHLHELLSRQDVQTLINNVKEKHPALIDELVPKILGIGEIQKVLANLLKESVSIRDLVTIFETLADYGTVTRDTDLLTEYVRQSLGRAISKKFLNQKANNVITLDPSLEQKVMDAVQQSEQGSYLALDPQTTQQIFEKLTREINRFNSIGQQPILLTSPIVRIYFKKLTEQIAPDLVVLSYNEVDSNIEVQSIGMVSLT